MALPPELQLIHDRLNNDLQYFMLEAPLMVINKQGALVPFRMNKAQRYIHARLEEQKRKTGMARALILKGRQEGCSQYMTARNFHLAIRNQGIATLLLSHLGSATQHLFSKIELYYKHMDPNLRPVLGTANRNQMYYSALESRTIVGTAGNEDVGRSGTHQILHWSEAAYTDNDIAVQDGAMQTIPDLPGTEIVLESTANGPKGLFYTMCQDALHGRGAYQLIFVPWWWMDEYEAEVSGHIPLEDEEQYAAVNLKDYTPSVVERKMNWRRNKIYEFAADGGLEGGKRKFRQIYPANPIEAFQSSGDGLFEPGAITAAQNSNVTDEAAPLIMGIDSAGNGGGGDRTCIAFRRGRELEEIIRVPKQPNMDMAVAGVIVRELEARKVDMAFIDVGYGHGTLDRVCELGFRNKIIGVNFGEGALRDDIFLNKRAEMIISFAEWVNGGGVRIPKDEALHSDMAIIPQEQTTSNGKRYIVPKKDIKKLYNGKSTDLLDAVALTFAFPVSRAVGGAVGENGRGGWSKKEGGKSPLKSMRRRQGNTGAGRR